MAPRSDAAQEEALAVAFVAVGWNTASRGPAIREGGAAAELPIPEARLTRVNAAQAAAVESKTGSRVYKFAGLRGYVFLASLATLASLPPFLPPLPAHAALKVSAG